MLRKQLNKYFFPLRTENPDYLLKCKSVY